VLSGWRSASMRLTAGWQRCRTSFFLPRTLQILLPLHGEKIPLFCVAFLARRGDVPAGGLSPSNEGDDMVHGQRGGGEFFSAVMADPAGQALLPPAGFAQNPGLFFFFPDFPLAYLDDEGIRHAFPAGETSGGTAFFRPRVESGRRRQAFRREVARGRNDGWESPRLNPFSSLPG
jgi:hypothetical protein